MTGKKLVRGLYGLSGRLTFGSFVGLFFLDFVIFWVMAFVAISIDNKSRTGPTHTVTTALLLVAVMVLAWAILSLIVRIGNTLKFYFWEKKHGFLGGEKTSASAADSETRESATKPAPRDFTDSSRESRFNEDFQAKCRQLLTSRMSADIKSEYVRDILAKNRLTSDPPTIIFGAKPIKIILVNAVVLMGFFVGLTEVEHIFARSETGAGVVIILVSAFGSILGLNLLRMKLFIFEDGFGVRSYFSTKFYRWSDIAEPFEFTKGARGAGRSPPGDDFVQFKTKPVTIGGRVVRLPENHALEGSLDIQANDLAKLMNIYLAQGVPDQEKNSSLTRAEPAHLLPHQVEDSSRKVPISRRSQVLLWAAIAPVFAWIFYDEYLPCVCPRIADPATGHTIYLYIQNRAGHSIVYVTTEQYYIHHVIAIAAVCDLIFVWVPLCLFVWWKKQQRDLA